MTPPSTRRSQKSRAARIALGARQVTVVLDAEGAEALKALTAGGASVKAVVQQALVMWARCVKNGRLG